VSSDFDHHWHTCPASPHEHDDAGTAHRFLDMPGLGADEPKAPRTWTGFEGEPATFDGTRQTANGIRHPASGIRDLASDPATGIRHPASSYGVVAWIRFLLRGPDEQAHSRNSLYQQ